ncbi:zinc-dependent metalloprotease [Buchananella hordeovulneris]|uniref:zinc-dependent metalloprotease n=1 Tax=Buchananella hordeovulneris TaxID=52770 RepID=UPI0026DB68F7|nr:zinc-dependent metalloprotease [Buchananella hordeovulneris]MDO5080878.1 zinc-dependent metalloprotease [Buchananella hordeovulneris]
MSEANVPDWEEMLRNLLGSDNADQLLAAMRASGLDPQSLGGSLEGIDPLHLQAMVEQTRRLLAKPTAGPVDWEVAHDAARHTAHGGDDPAVLAAQAAQVSAALQTADLWLDVVTDFAPTGLHRHAWSRAQWVEQTMPVWRQVMEPVAASAVEALSQAIAERVEADGLDLTGQDLPGLEGLTGFDGLDTLASLAGGQGPGLGTMLQRVAALAFAAQIGQAVGSLARECFGAGDVGLPLTVGAAALLPSNVEAFMDGLDLASSEVLAFLAVRESATARLYASVPWLRPHVLALVTAYAREIRLDTAAIEQAVAELEGMDPDSVRDALSAGMFSPRPSPAQERALLQLETTLAVVEGWVDEVSFTAVAPHLPNAHGLRELLRRRRATGGPAEHLFSSLVGLQLRPRRARDASRLWAHVGRDLGVAARDALWDHPDLMPTAEELSSPDTFVRLRQLAADADADLDAQLASLLDGSLAQDAGAAAHDAAERARRAAAPGDESRTADAGPPSSGPAEAPGTEGPRDAAGEADEADPGA